MTVAVHAKVDTAVDTQLQRVVRTQGELLQVVSGLGRQIRGKDFLGTALLVLGLVIEHFAFDDDLAHRQRLTIEDPDRQLAAGDEPLDHHFIVVPLGQLDRGTQIGRLAYDAQPDGRALLVRFDDNRPPQSLTHIVSEHGSHQPVGGWNPRGAKQPLGEILVHRRGARDVIAAGVSQARQVQDRLNPSVLTRSAVQRKKHDVDIANVGGVRRQGQSGLTHTREHRA